MPIQCRFPVNFFLRFFFISQFVHKKRFINFVFQTMCIFTVKIGYKEKYLITIIRQRVNNVLNLFIMLI